jgi:hypothetical protein
MGRALIMVRQQPHYRREAFESGARAAGLTLVTALHDPKPGDVLVIWNRYGSYDAMARACEKGGGKVIVVENGYFGRDADGNKPYAMHRSLLHGFGAWPDGEEDRWSPLGIPLAPWRSDGREVLVLAQRGIGIPPVSSTPDDAQRIASTIRARTGLPVRVRKHPGDREPEVPLAEDLRDALCAVCHTSAAGLHAMIMGVPVITTGHAWIGRPAANYIGPGELENWSNLRQLLFRDDAARIATLRRVAWAQWTVAEIASGRPFRLLLEW